MRLQNPASALGRKPEAASPAAGPSPVARSIPGVEQMRRTLGYAPRPVPRLADPQHNVESEPSGTDFTDDPVARYDAEMAENERRRQILSLCERRFTAGKAMLTPACRDWYEGQAMFLNRPWHTWNVRTGQFQDMRDPNGHAHGRRYTSRNLIKSKVLNAAAHVCQMAPELGISPATPGPLDQGAAHDFRRVRESLDRQFDRAAQTFDAVLTSKISAPPLRKCVYNPALYARMPLLDEQGQVQEVFDAQVGDIEEALVMPGSWCGPGGDFDKMPWLIEYHPVLCSTIEATWANGWAVQAEKGLMSDTSVGLLVSSSDGEYARGSGMDDAKCAMLKELWEKPTPRYPGGRWLVWAGDVLLHEGEWPYPEMARKGWFPYVPLYHLRLPNSLWGENMVSDMIDPQRSVNERMSKALEHSALPPFMVLAYNGAQISRGYWEGSDIRIIDVQGDASRVDVQPKPPMDAITMDVLELEKGFLDTISMNSAVSEGIAPYAGMSAEQTQALQTADAKSSEAELTALRWHMTRLGWLEFLLAKQFYTQPRMALSSSEGEGGAAMTPLTFRSIQQGGMVHIEAAATSPHTPAAKVGFLQSLAAQGGFQAPNLMATRLLLKASDMFGDDDDFFEELDAMIAQAQAQEAANQPNPAQIQDMKNQAAAQAQKQDQEHAQTMAAVQEQVEAAKFHAEGILQNMKDQAQMDHDQRMAAIDLHSKETLAQQGAAVQQQIAQMNGQIQVLLKNLPAVTGALDPAAQVDWEKQHGLEGEEPPPPTVAPAGGAKPKAGKAK